MANPFRDMSVIMQALVAAAVAVVLVLVGVYVPGSPIARERDEVDSAVQKRTKLNQEVTQLQVYKQRYGELKQQMDALSKQLDTLKTIVPEEKETDEFIRLLQGAASASSVQIRRLTAQAIVPKSTTTKCRSRCRPMARTSISWISSGGWAVCRESSMWAT